MSNRIEIESKFFCKEKEKLYNVISELKMIKTEENKEIDEYFTDLNCEYIKNRTCLRIRTTNDKNMELTFKGRSKNLDSTYVKKESNIKLNADEYIDVYNLLNSLGYYSYVKVIKNRIVYTKKEKNLIYNIMIDEIKNVGNFLEIEILCENDEYSTEELKVELENFILCFKIINLEIVNLPYRDLVANKYIKNLKGINNTNLLVFNNDKFIKDDIINNSKLLIKLRDVGINLSLVTNFKESLNFKNLFSNIVIKKEIDKHFLEEENCLSIIKSKEEIKKLEKLGVKIIYIDKDEALDNNFNENIICVESFEQFILLLIANYEVL